MFKEVEDAINEAKRVAALEARVAELEALIAAQIHTNPGFDAFRKEGGEFGQ